MKIAPCFVFFFGESCCISLSSVQLVLTMLLLCRKCSHLQQPLLSVKISFNFLFVSLFQVLHRAGPSSQPVYVVTGLKPYHMYNFTVTLCTKTGCVTSLPSTGRTLPAGKIKRYAHEHTWMQTNINMRTYGNTTINHRETTWPVYNNSS